MAIIPTNYFLAGLDLTAWCRNYRHSKNDGTDVRMGNRSKAVEALAHALNRCLAHQPRLLFSKAQPVANADSAGSDPLYICAYDDSVTNARDVVYRTLAVPRTSGTGDSYLGRYTGGAVVDKTSNNNYTAASVDQFEDTFYDDFVYARGAAADAEVSEAVSTFDGFTALDVVLQEKPLSQLDTTIHNVVDPAEAKKGQVVLADILEDIRAHFHELQTTSRPRCFSWSAAGAAGSWATPASTDQTAIVVTSGSQKNVIDQTVTSRTGTSPGVSCHVQHAGWGAQDEDNGKLVKVLCRVYGKASGGSANGTVRFHGPNFSAGGGASNYVDITITHGAANAWYGDANDFIYLDASAADTATGTGRNKVDIFGWISGVTTETMYLYGLSGWQTGPPY